MPKFIFDGPTKTIEGDPSAVVSGVFSFTAQELYSEWVDWTTQGDNLKYLPAFSTAGGDSLGGGTFLGAYVFIRNDLGWRGVPPDVGDVQVVIEGNFYPTNETLPFFIPWPGVVTVISSRVSQMTQTVEVNTGGGSTLSVPDIVAGVWGANISTYPTNTAGNTLYNQLNGLTPTQSTMLLELYQIFGLDPTKPLTVTNTSRTAGTISQTIVSDSNSTVLTRN